MEVHVCSFASASYVRAQALQREQWTSIGLKEEHIHSLGPEHLADDFHRDLPYACEENRLGYYSFKPYVLRNLAQAVPPGSALLYLDAFDCPLTGLLEYVANYFQSHPRANILAPATNYPNWHRSSWYHRSTMPASTQLVSKIYCQPEAGAVAMRASGETVRLLDIWYRLTVNLALALRPRDVILSTDEERASLLTQLESGVRFDQETLFLLSCLHNGVRFESWFAYRLLSTGMRRFIRFEHFRGESV